MSENLDLWREYYAQQFQPVQPVAPPAPTPEPEAPSRSLGEVAKDSWKNFSIGTHQALAEVAGAGATGVNILSEITGTQDSSVNQLATGVRDVVDRDIETLEGQKAVSNAETFVGRMFDPVSIADELGKLGMQFTLLGGAAGLGIKSLQAVGVAERTASAIGVAAMAAAGGHLESAPVYEEALAKGKTQSAALRDYAESIAWTTALNLPQASFILQKFPESVRNVMEQKILGSGISAATEWLEEGVQHGIVEDDYLKVWEGMKQSPEIILPAFMMSYVTSGKFTDGAPATRQQQFAQLASEALETVDTAGSATFSYDGAVYVAQRGEDGQPVFTALADDETLLGSLGPARFLTELSTAKAALIGGQPVELADAKPLYDPNGAVETVRLATGQIVPVHSFESFIHEDGAITTAAKDPTLSAEVAAIVDDLKILPLEERRRIVAEALKSNVVADEATRNIAEQETRHTESEILNIPVVAEDGVAIDTKMPLDDISDLILARDFAEEPSVEEFRIGQEQAWQGGLGARSDEDLEAQALDTARRDEVSSEVRGMEDAIALGQTDLGYTLQQAKRAPVKDNVKSVRDVFRSVAPLLESDTDIGSVIGYYSSTASELEGLVSAEEIVAQKFAAKGYATFDVTQSGGIVLHSSGKVRPAALYKAYSEAVKSVKDAVRQVRRMDLAPQTLTAVGKWSPQQMSAQEFTRRYNASHERARIENELLESAYTLGWRNPEDVAANTANLVYSLVEANAAAQGIAPNNILKGVSFNAQDVVKTTPTEGALTQSRKEISAQISELLRSGVDKSDPRVQELIAKNREVSALPVAKQEQAPRKIPPVNEITLPTMEQIIYNINTAIAHDEIIHPRNLGLVPDSLNIIARAPFDNASLNQWADYLRQSSVVSEEWRVAMENVTFAHLPGDTILSKQAVYDAIKGMNFGNFRILEGPQTHSEYNIWSLLAQDMNPVEIILQSGLTDSRKHFASEGGNSGFIRAFGSKDGERFYIHEIQNDNKKLYNDYFSSLLQKAALKYAAAKGYRYVYFPTSKVPAKLWAAHVERQSVRSEYVSSFTIPDVTVEEIDEMSMQDLQFLLINWLNNDSAESTLTPYIERNQQTIKVLQEGLTTGGADLSYEDAGTERGGVYFTVYKMTAPKPYAPYDHQYHKMRSRALKQLSGPKKGAVEKASAKDVRGGRMKRSVALSEHTLKVIRSMPPDQQQDQQMLKDYAYSALMEEGLSVTQAFNLIDNARFKFLPHRGKITIRNGGELDVPWHVYDLQDYQTQILSTIAPLFQKGATIRGEYRFDERDLRHLITFYRGSEVDTALHEIGHLFRQTLSDEHLRKAAVWAGAWVWNEATGGWVKATKSNVANASHETMAWRLGRDTSPEERFADTFLEWVYGTKHGDLPDWMKTVFKKYRRWLITLYKQQEDEEGISQRPGVEVSPEMREFFRDLIARDAATEPMAADKKVKLTLRYLKSKKARESTRNSDELKVRGMMNPRRTIVSKGAYELLKEFGAPDVPVESQEYLYDDAVRLLQDNPNWLDHFAERLAQGQGIAPIDAMAMRIIAATETEIVFNEVRKLRSTAELSRFINKKKGERLAEVVRLYSDSSNMAGRVLAAFRKEIDSIELLRALVDIDRTDPESLTQLMKFLQNPQVHASAVINAAATLKDPTFKEMFFQVIYGNMLSSPATIGLNSISTMMWAMFWQPAHVALAGTVDWAVKGMHAKGVLPRLIEKHYYGGKNVGVRQHYFGEVLPRMFGWGTGFPRGVSYAKEIMFTKRGILENAYLSSTYEMDIHSDNIDAMQRHANPIVQGLGVLFSIPNRFMRASDIIFKTMAYDAEIQAIAYRRGIIEQQKGNIPNTAAALANFRGNYVPNQEDSLQAEFAARYHTFMDMPGRATRRLLEFRQDVWPVQLLLPFVNTLVNLGKRGLEMTPGLGIYVESMQARDRTAPVGKRGPSKAKRYTQDTYGHRSSDVIAKQIEGAVIALMIFLLLDDDEMTGVYPSDPAERAAFEAARKLPWAIRYGDKWVSYERLDPINVPLKLIASLRDAVRERPDMDADQFSARLWDIGAAITSTVLNTAFMRNVDDYAEARRGEDMAKLAGRQAEAMLIPYSGFWRWMYRNLIAVNDNGHPVAEEIDGAMMAVIGPNISTFLQAAGMDIDFQRMPKMDLWGEQVVLDERTVFSTWMPVRTRTAATDEVELALAELEYQPRMPQRTFEFGTESIEFDHDVYAKYVVAAGKFGKDVLRRVVSTPGYQSLDRPHQRELLERVLRESREPWRKKAQGEQLQRRLLSRAGSAAIAP